MPNLLTLQEFIETSNKIHNYKYNYDKVIYVNLSTSVIITCPIHGDFVQNPKSHKNGAECFRCGIIKRSKKRAQTTEQFIERSKLTHGDKYDYSKVNYINNHTDVIIICKDHDEFLQNPKLHIEGANCPKCSIITVTKKITKTLETFINEAREIHGNKYDYSKFIYTGINKKGIIICPVNHEFEQTPSNHLSGQGCRKCGRIVCANKQRKTLDKFIEDARKMHGDKYDYSLVNYVMAHTKVCIICPSNHKFWQPPNQHIHGAGCPYCFNTISKKENIFLDNYLKLPNDLDHRQVKIGKKRVDGYDPENKIIYEFLGDYFHGNPLLFKTDEYNKRCHVTHGELYTQTIKRFDVLKSMGYTIKYVWEYDWKRYLKGLVKELKIITH